MQKQFKVGDRVLVVGDDLYKALIGKTGIIVKVMRGQPYPYIVHIDGLDDWNVQVGQQDGLLFGGNELQLIGNALQRLKERYANKVKR